MIRIMFIVLSLMQLAPAHAQQMVTEVFPLGYRSLAEITPVVQPLVSPNGSVSGLRDQLVVTATARQMAQVKALLAQLDRRPVRLLISVRQGSSEEDRRGSAAVQGRVGNLTVGGGGVVLEHSGSGSADGDSIGLSARASVRSDDYEDSITQRVQVLEGYEAYIHSGEMLPLRQRGTGAGPGDFYHYNSISYYPAVTGFYAVPRMHGDEVTLRLSTVSRQREPVYMHQYGSYYGRPIDVTGVSTTLSGRLGDWIAVGSVSGSANHSTAAIGSTGRHSKVSGNTLYLRVEKVQRQR